MKKALAIALLLASGEALAGSWGSGFDRGGWNAGYANPDPWSGGNATAALYQWTSSGPQLPEPAGTVSHVIFDGAQLVDPYQTWTQQGTVPQGAGQGILYPSGFSGSSRSGAGIFSDVNYYSSTDAALRTTTFTVCALVNPLGSAGGIVVETRGSAEVGDAGWKLFADSTTAYLCNSACTSLGSTVGNGPNLICATRNGATGEVRGFVNAAAPAQKNANMALTAGAGPTLIGRRGSVGQFFTGHIYEVLISNALSDDATLTRFAQTFFGLPPGLTVTRASTEACQVGTGPLFYVPANTLCVNGSGAQIFGSTTETLLHTIDIVSGSAAVAPWTALAQTKAAPTLSTASIVDPTGATSTVARADFSATDAAEQISCLYQSYTATATSWTDSIYMRTVSGTATVYLTTYITASGTSAGTTACALTTSWSRCTYSKTKTATGWTLVVGPDTRALIGVQPTVQPAASVYLWQANATPTASAFPPVTATTTTVASTATVVSAPNPLSPANPNGWCVSSTMDPAGRPWNTVAVLPWTMGALGAANSAYFQIQSSGFTSFYTYDATATGKEWFGTGVLAAGPHSFVVCDNGGAYSMTLDGAAYGIAGLGSGTGIIASMPSTINIGSSGSVQFINGFLSRFRVCRRGSTGACQ